MLATFEAMKTVLRRPQPAFLDARARHPELADFATPADVLAALSPKAPTEVRAKDRIVASLVDEVQKHPSAAVNALLALVFEPLLVNLRGQCGSSKNEDRDQELMLAFFEVVRETTARVYTIVVIKWSMEARTRSWRRAATSATSEKDIPELDFDRHHPTGPGARADVKLEVSQILDAIEADGGRELVDAVVASDIGNEPLKDYVARIHAEAPEGERLRIYERLVRARTHAFARLRTRLLLSRAA